MKKIIMVILTLFIIVLSSGFVFADENDKCIDKTLETGDYSNSDHRSLIMSNDKSQMYFFYLPGGGVSTCSVYILYHEEYTQSNTPHNNTFFSRGKYYTGYYTYATQCPVLVTGAAVIKNGSGSVYLTYTSWTQVYSIYNGYPDVYGYYENYGSFTLSDSTAYTGQVNYSVNCSGANPTVYPDYVGMGLATN